MIVFDGAGLHAVLVPLDPDHIAATAIFREAVDQGKAWTTSFAIADVEARLGHLSRVQRQRILENIVRGLEVVWVGPDLARRATREMRDGESLEQATARLVATALGGRYFSVVEPVDAGEVSRENP